MSTRRSLYFIEGDSESPLGVPYDIIYATICMRK